MCIRDSGAIEEERLSPAMGLWSIHMAFALLSVALLVNKKQWSALLRRKPAVIKG